MELTIEQALQQGVAAHKEGKLQEAERLYRAILQSQPEHPDANHNLGVIAVSVNKSDAALPLFKTALEANPKIEQFWLSYIDALIKEKQFDNAKQVIQQGKQHGLDGEGLKGLEVQLPPKNQKPDIASQGPPQDELSSLLEHYQNGRFSEAETLAISLTQEFPNHEFAWKVLGAVLGQTGRKSEALDASQKAVALSPQDPTAHSNLGNTLKELGRLDEAEASYKQAIALRPDYAEAHNNLGATLKELGRLDEACASYNQAIALEPNYAEAHNNLGGTLKELGKLDEAEANCKQAIALKPDYAEAHNNLAATLKDMSRLDEAEASYNQAIVLKPDYAEAHSNLGNTLQELGRSNEAEASLTKAIALKPDYAEAHCNMGNTLQELGRSDEAEASYKQAIVLKPDFAEAHSNLGVTLQALGRLDEASASYNQAIKLNPEHSSAKHLLAALSGETTAPRNYEEGLFDSLGNELKPSNLKRSAVFAVEEFYKNITKKSLSEAAMGWFFADSFDRYFMEANPLSIIPKKEKTLLQKQKSVSTNEQKPLSIDASQILKKLANKKSISEKYSYLKELINSNDVNLVNDSFRGDANADLEHALQNTFDNQNLNIVIIGGGVCGLFLANSIKSFFGKRANVLVLDNRSTGPNTRETFKRNWLTNIPVEFFQIAKTPDLLALMECFGTNGLIGIPINILEAVLQLSCKDQSVKFHFSETSTYSILSNDVIDLVFDATGGRLKECSNLASNSNELALNIPRKKINGDPSGVKQLRNIPGVGGDYWNFTLKPHGDFHRPYIEDSQIYTYMVKLTGIPVNLIQTIKEAVRDFNFLNLFYIWTGTLRTEINEGLTIINLLDKEYGFLSSILEGPVTLKSLLGNNPNISDYLNKNVFSILEMLEELDVDSQIKIEQPFEYCPYINLNAGSGLLSGKRVFPVGDSLFCGHPKLGNGLGSHLPIINELVQTMNKYWSPQELS